MTQTVQVHVKFFALFREYIGVKEEWTEIKPGMTVEQLWLRYVEHAHNSRVGSVRPAFSVNQRLAQANTLLQGGEEVGFLPPVSGGAGHRPQGTGRKAQVAGRKKQGAGRKAQGTSGKQQAATRITQHASRPAHHEPRTTSSSDFFVTTRSLKLSSLIGRVEHPGAGAIVTFTGVVRDNAHERTVRRLEYEAYDEMARQTLADIGAEACARWEGVRVAMAHRTGRMEIGEASVIIVVSSPHRAEAFAACRYAIERIKAALPVWKKEFASDTEYWVEGPVAGEISPEHAAQIANQADWDADKRG